MPIDRSGVAHRRRTGAPQIALGPPGVRAYLADAVVAGGGELVEPADAEALVWGAPAGPDQLEAAVDEVPDAVWVQLPWAGIEPFVEVLDSDRLWTCGKGVYAEPVAEHALALALAGMRGIGRYARATSWDSEQVGTNLLGADVVVLGAGGITSSFLRLLDPFDCNVTVVRRTPEPVTGARSVVALAELDDVLPGADLVVLALALTPQTIGVIDAARLALLDRHSWLVNVARGRHIVTDDLVDALSREAIGGAALDVTDPEPLPDDHPLWRAPNCIITPHLGNTQAMALPVLSARVTENVRRFAAGEPLLGVVDVDAGY